MGRAFLSLILLISLIDLTIDEVLGSVRRLLRKKRIVQNERKNNDQEA